MVEPQFGNYLPMDELHKDGILVMKYWSTVNDNRVTPTHTQNQNNGWIMLDEAFTGTGDKIAPASDNPRCRCAIEYKVGGPKNGVQSEEMKQIISASTNSRNARETLDAIKQNYNPDNMSDDLNHAMTYWDERKEYSDLETLNVNKLTREELVSVYEYSVFQYEHINNALRKNMTNSDMNGLIINMTSGLEKFSSHIGLVWRGTSSEIAINQIKQMSPGDVFSDSGFMSSSVSRSVAKKFQGENGIMMKITSKTGKNIDSITWSNEKEVVFLPGGSYRFIEKKNEVYIFEEI